MKKTKKIFGIIAIIAMIGLLFAGCDEPSDKGPGSGEGTGEESWPPSSSELLTAGVWKNGEITETIKTIWYRFPVNAGKSYRFWWNDVIQGDGDKTLDIQVSAFYSDQDFAFEKIDSAWTTARSIAPKADDTIYIKVISKNEGDTGTFGVVFVEGGSTQKPDTIVYPDSADMETLTLNTWKQYEFTIDVQEIWYKVTNLSSLGYYHFWWNDSKEGNGDVDVTVDVEVTAWTSGKSTIFPRTDSGWVKPKTIYEFDIFPSSAIWVRVTPKTKGATGTFDFNCTYASSSSYAPEWPFLAPKNAKGMTVAQWENGEIKENLNGESWYTYTADATANYLWWNDSKDGNGAATLDVQVDAWRVSGTTPTKISITYNDDAWKSSKTMANIAVGNDIYLRVRPKVTDETGTFDILYNTSNVRPWLKTSKTTELTIDKWNYGEITDESNEEEWHSFKVEADETYYVWGNIKYSDNYGDGTVTLNAGFYAFDDKGKLLHNSGNWWNARKEIKAAEDGMIYIKVFPDNTYDDRTGTYGILYSKTNTRIPTFTLPPASEITTLNAKEWKDGNITTAGGEAWYTFDTATGDNYFKIWWNDKGEGDGSKGLDVIVSAWYKNGDGLYTSNNYKDSGWLKSDRIDKTGINTVYIRVMPKNKGETGSFCITYDISSSYSNVDNRPFSVPTNPIQLTLGEWKNAEVTDPSRGEVWHKVSVTNGTYGIWVNGKVGSGGTISGDGSKTLSVGKFQAYYSDGTSIVDSFNSVWEGRTFSATKTDTIYIVVRPDPSTAVGTYGIVCAANNERPVQIDFPVTTTALTSGVWKDDTMSAAEAWYSFTIQPGISSHIWLNDLNDGNGKKDLDVLVSAWLEDGDPFLIQDQYGDFKNILDNGWLSRGNPYSIHQSESVGKKVYVKVIPKTAGKTGTFGIAYVSNNKTYGVRPFLKPDDSVIVSLTEGNWADGVITTLGEDKWYSFPVNNGTTYRVWWNENATNNNNCGDGTKSLNAYVTGYYGNGNVIETSSFNAFDQSDGWDSSWAPKFTSNYTGIAYFKVYPQYLYEDTNVTYKGTFGIAYNIGDTATRPATSLPEMTELTVGEWKNGDLPPYDKEWYKFTATAASQYIHIYLNTLSSLRIQLYDSDMKTVQNGNNYFTSNKYINCSLTIGNTYYVRIEPYFISSSGTYKIAFNASSTAPANP